MNLSGEDIRQSRPAGAGKQRPPGRHGRTARGWVCAVWVWCCLLPCAVLRAAEFTGSVAGTSSAPQMRSFTLAYRLATHLGEPTYQYAFRWEIAPDATNYRLWNCPDHAQARDLGITAVEEQYSQARQRSERLAQESELLRQDVLRRRVGAEQDRDIQRDLATPRYRPPRR